MGKETAAETKKKASVSDELLRYAKISPEIRDKSMFVAWCLESSCFSSLGILHVWNKTSIELPARYLAPSARLRGPGRWSTSARSVIPGRGCSWAKDAGSAPRGDTSSCTPDTCERTWQKIITTYAAKTMQCWCSAFWRHSTGSFSQNWLLDDSCRPREWDALILQRFFTQSGYRLVVSPLAVNLHLKSQRSPWLLTKSWLLLYIHYIYTYIYILFRLRLTLRIKYS